MTIICVFNKYKLFNLYNNESCKREGIVLFYSHKEEMQQQIFQQSKISENERSDIYEQPAEGNRRKEKMKSEYKITDI